MSRCSSFLLARYCIHSSIFTSDKLPKIVNCPLWGNSALVYFDYLLTVVRYVQQKKKKRFVNAKCLVGPSPKQRQLSLHFTSLKLLQLFIYLFIDLPYLFVYVECGVEFATLWICGKSSSCLESFVALVLNCWPMAPGRPVRPLARSALALAGRMVIIILHGPSGLSVYPSVCSSPCQRCWRHETL